MSLSIEKRWPLVLLAALASFVAFAIISPAAKATDVQPVNASATATNSTPTDFISVNAYGPIGIVCNESEAKFSISDTSDRNQNQNGVGTFSNDNGSVIVDMDVNGNGDQAPTFTDCFVGLWDAMNPGAPPADVGDATVVTNDTNGAWTVTADAVTSSNNVVGIGVPKAGAVINVTSPVPCTITVSSAQASSVFGDYTNGTTMSPASTLEVDGQIDFDPGACVALGVTTPAQFQGDYSVTADPPNAATPVTINP